MTVQPAGILLAHLQAGAHRPANYKAFSPVRELVESRFHLSESS